MFRLQDTIINHLWLPVICCSSCLHHSQCHCTWDVALGKGVFKPSSRSCVIWVIILSALCVTEIYHRTCLQHACKSHLDVINTSYKYLQSLLGTADSTNALWSLFSTSVSQTSLPCWSLNQLSLCILYLFCTLIILLNIIVHECVCMCPLGHWNYYITNDWW